LGVPAGRRQQEVVCTTPPTDGAERRSSLPCRSPKR
jgi:hypothetical protein